MPAPLLQVSTLHTLPIDTADLIASLENYSRESPSSFPGHGSTNYHQRLNQIREFLVNNIYKNVSGLAATVDGGYLTDHGVDHVETVIRHASSLVNLAKEALLMPYEIYILLAAIYLHDAGNCLGRDNHETRVAEILANMGTVAGSLSAEKRIISKIALAHGGSFHGDKDTISKITKEEKIDGHTIRLQLLAAILRLADELSDDQFRAARYALSAGLIPNESQVYHAYAARLNSVVVDPNSCRVELVFVLNADDAKKKYGKKDQQVFLLDEIYARTAKMHIERIYCMRFLKEYLHLDAVKVHIEVYNRETDMSPAEVIDYTLEETGYPASQVPKIESLCRHSLTQPDGQLMTGAWLKRQARKWS